MNRGRFTNPPARPVVPDARVARLHSGSYRAGRFGKMGGGGEPAGATGGVRMNRPLGTVFAGLVAAAGLAAGCSAGAQPPTKKSGFAEDTVPKVVPAAEFPFDKDRAVGYV